eukprot:gnl/MRDRNA2_/MRDRNA2_18879_c0_seq1.p1 gnl/MRDRNA2_/MRDRNA2_18879_c0~~gnl/MRDRNA2_/MRDRNA2_18879_c0_seq1.p1  ORF type:complete len:345 (-),score=68.08 gnl/MRDRNA2_/MRDRNA2_18879_c0_seq1:66-1100(-)
MHSRIAFILVAFFRWVDGDELTWKHALPFQVSPDKVVDKLADAIFGHLVQASGQLRSVIDKGPSNFNPLEHFPLPWGVSSRADSSMKLKTTGSSSGQHQAKVLKLKPFVRQRPVIDMDKTVEQVLAEKGVWRSQQIIGSVAQAKGVMDVNSSPTVVWNQLFDFPSYPRKVPVACAADVYGHGTSNEHSSQLKFSQSPFSFISSLNLPQLSIANVQFPHLPFPSSDLFQSIAPGLGGKQRILVKFQSAVVPGVKVTAHCELLYEPAKNSVTYQLDRNMKNHFDEVQGHWHVEPHPRDSSKTCVFYEMALTIPGFLPRPLVNHLARTVVKEATAWVKEESEKEAAR